ncbi:MAG: hypothetical protein WAN93_01765 [Solirubrobacteraceae bacterium]
MLSIIRRRVTYANVAMTLALVFAMSGGAFAAGKYLITSTKQISPKVLKSLKGADGKNGASGATGAASPAGAVGAVGPQGPTGPSGATGAKGETGAAGAAGKEGKAGKEGSPWTLGGTLPSGKTETGIWAFDELREAGSHVVPVASFAIPLAAPLSGSHAHFINEKGLEIDLEEEEVESAECKGTAAAPAAEPGNLCIYTSTLAGATAGSTSIGNVPKAGAMMVVFVPGPGGAKGSGSWAVTAE